MSKLGKPKDDELAYMLEVDDDELRVRLTLFSGVKLNPRDYILALEAFVTDYKDSPEHLFDDACEMPDDRH